MSNWSRNSNASSARDGEPLQPAGGQNGKRIGPPVGTDPLPWRLAQGHRLSDARYARGTGGQGHEAGESIDAGVDQGRRWGAPGGAGGVGWSRRAAALPSAASVRLGQRPFFGERFKNFGRFVRTTVPFSGMGPISPRKTGNPRRARSVLLSSMPICVCNLKSVSFVS